jgi:hypothetical protein
MMTHIKRIIITVLLSPLFCHASGELAHDKPAVGEGEILFFTGLNQAWIHIYQKDFYTEISQKIQLKNRRPKELMILVEIFGVQEKKAENLESPNDKQQKLILTMNKKLKNVTVSMSCIAISQKSGSPVCEINIEKMNLGLSIIENGLSTYNDSTQVPKLDKIYRDTYRIAKEKGIGIWEPFYGLFKEFE